ncbi:MAG: rod shape-determining protein [Magnetococcus sp. DMHC-8]
MTTGNPHNALLLGIDFGTSRTAVMSNRKFKELVHSVVGYPRDIIGVKILNRTQVIGIEALEKRSLLDLHFPLENGVLREGSDKELEAAHELLRYTIELAEPRAGEKICGVIGVPARASVANKEQLLKLTEGLMDIAMVVSEPFMVAYGLSKLTNAFIVDIGAGTTDICAMKGTVPAVDNQATILKGGDYIDELLVAAVRDAYPTAQLDRHVARRIKEKFAFVGEPGEPVIQVLRLNGKPTEVDLTDAIRATCETIVPDIVEHLKRLLLVFDADHQAEALANIILAGGGSRIRGLGAMIGHHLREYGDVRVTMVADPDFSGAQGALKLAMELPPEYWNQIGDVIGTVG